MQKCRIDGDFLQCVIRSVDSREISLNVKKNPATDDPLLGPVMDAQSVAHVGRIFGNSSEESEFTTPHVTKTVPLRSSLRVERIEPVIPGIAVELQHRVLKRLAPVQGRVEQVSIHSQSHALTRLRLAESREHGCVIEQVERAEFIGATEHIPGVRDSHARQQRQVLVRREHEGLSASRCHSGRPAASSRSAPT